MVGAERFREHVDEETQTHKIGSQKKPEETGPKLMISSVKGYAFVKENFLPKMNFKTAG